MQEMLKQIDISIEEYKFLYPDDALDYLTKCVSDGVEIPVFGLSGHRSPALISGPRPLAPVKVSICSTSSYLKFSHYDHVHITFNGIRVSLNHVDLLMLHVTTCFKQTALLFTVHLSCFVDFILCLTDKHMFKVNNKKINTA